MKSNVISELIFNNISVLSQVWQNEHFFEYGDNVRPYHGLCFILNGSIRYETKKEAITAKEGDIVIINKYSRYKAIFDNSPATKDILVNFQCISPDFKQDYFLCENEITVLKNRFDAESNFQNILSYFNASGRECMVKSEMFSIFDKLTAPQDNFGPFKHIKQELLSDDVLKLNESELAGKCFISVSAFQRNFKKVYGKTFSEYKNELKIIKAKELLTKECYSVGEISEMLGFCDSAYFSKYFKKSTGVSPKKYVKQFYTM